jgi:hypothetical protein
MIIKHIKLVKIILGHPAGRQANKKILTDYGLTSLAKMASGGKQAGRVHTCPIFMARPLYATN